jgi:hypothetical protein
MSNELQISLHSEPNTALPGATVKPDSKRCMDKVRSLSDAFVNNVASDSGTNKFARPGSAGVDKYPLHPRCCAARDSELTQGDGH